MTERKGMGRVHDGFYGALFHGDQEGGSLFDDLVAAIRAADDGEQKDIYLTGALEQAWFLRCHKKQCGIASIDILYNKNFAVALRQQCSTWVCARMHGPHIGS